MKHSVMVMSPGVGALECELRSMLEFETLVAPPVEAGGCWGFPEVCPEGAEGFPEGAEGAAGCAVEPVGVGVNLILAAMGIGDKGHDRGGYSAKRS
jgi:hypothetical protein